MFICEFEYNYTYEHTSADIKCKYELSIELEELYQYFKIYHEYENNNVKNDLSVIIVAMFAFLRSTE